MKKTALLLGAIASAGIGSIAAPSVAEAQPVTPSWTGFYIGGSGGGAWGSSTHVDGGVTTTIPHIRGAVAGGGAGYNWQSGPWVTGFETDLSWANVKGRADCDSECTTKVEALGTVRARLGFILGGAPVYSAMPARTAPAVASYSGPLVYATGGFAYGHVHGSDDFLFLSSTKWLTGWTAGGGVEWKLAGNWTAKLEYLYIDLHQKTFEGSFLGAPSPEFINAKTNVVRVGLNYQFATGGMPQR
jgi:outer membrane immunogenic protein